MTQSSYGTRIHPKETTVETYLVAGVRRLGGRCEKFIPTRKGMPDRVVLLPGGKTVFIELKRPGGRISAHQTLWIQHARELGHDAMAITSRAEVDEWLESVEHETKRWWRSRTAKRLDPSEGPEDA